MLQLIYSIAAVTIAGCYLAAAGYLAHAWSEGDERIARRIHGLFLIFFVVVIALLQIYA